MAKVNAYYTATFTGPISSILITRFMLELRAVDRALASDLSDLSGTVGNTGDSTTSMELTSVILSDGRRSLDRMTPSLRHNLGRTYRASGVVVYLAALDGSPRSSGNYGRWGQSNQSDIHDDSSSTGEWLAHEWSTRSMPAV
ncbi:uncharacterized protein B0H18DRAFT_1121385 [Fomitopsis serialis]|uniref:uncharacterized protein n=1 Tax=Fomitopsis serialis TaxID=139415 RepID=UPI0020086AA9|nr:uncharacterized protein B0H18DRAFT_1121385 [Neoantrodia serialis]KAH9921419.1 hypothetical protein B0H18DRAFT_1121385 [Neoantrodia serialis]